MTGTAPGPERAALRAAVARLEALTARLGDSHDPPSDLAEVARELAEASAAVTDILPRAIREAEGSPSPGPPSPGPPSPGPPSPGGEGR